MAIAPSLDPPRNRRYNSAMSTAKNSPGSYRLQIRLPDDWQAAVESAAEKAGKSVSAWARDALAAQLPAAERKRLGQVSPGRPPAEK